MFRRNATLAAVGNFSTTLALAAVIIATARLGGPEDVGRFSYALALAAPIYLLASLRLRDISSTEPEESYSLLIFFAVSIATHVLACVLLVSVACLLNFDEVTILTAVAIGLWKTVVSLSDVVFGFHQRATAMNIIAGSQLVHCVATMVCFVMVFYVTREIHLSLIAVFIANLLLFVVVDLWPVRGELKAADRSELFSRAFQIALQTFPLGVAGAIVSLNMLIPRWLIEGHYSLELVGIFSALVFGTRLGTPVMQAVGQTASRRIADAVQSRQPEKFKKILFGNRIFLSIALGGILIAIGWAIGPVILKMIYGAEYGVSRLAAGLTVFYALLIYASTFLTYGLIAARKHTSQLMILVATVVAGLVCGLFLVPKLGIDGACLSLVASGIVRLIGTGAAMNAIVAQLRSEPSVPDSAT